MSFFSKKAKPKTTAIDMEVAARAVDMTATEVRLRRGESLAGTVTGGWTTTSTAGPGVTGPWASTSSGTAWTLGSISPVSPQRETFNVYRCEVYDGLLLRINGDSYIKLGEVGEPNPAIHIVSSDLVTLVGNLLDWAMEALHE